MKIEINKKNCGNEEKEIKDVEEAMRIIDEELEKQFEKRFVKSDYDYLDNMKCYIEEYERMNEERKKAEEDGDNAKMYELDDKINSFLREKLAEHIQNEIKENGAYYFYLDGKDYFIKIMSNEAEKTLEIYAERIKNTI